MLNHISYADQIKYVRECPSAECLNQTLHELAKQCEFDYYQFNLFLPSGLLQSHVSILRHRPENWLDLYWQNQFAAHDPLLLISLRHNQPIIWHELSSSDTVMTEQGLSIMNQRAEHGMREGVTLPIHSGQGHHGMLHLSREQATGDVLSMLPRFGLLYPYIFQRACELMSPPGPNLSERERQCLFWVSEGKTSWEAAKILGITERTVNFHLNSAIRKTGCKNRYQAIARNIAAGQLRPDLQRLNIIKNIRA
jgi:DNA-binding CsgD family transcriptional regulator